MCSRISLSAGGRRGRSFELALFGMAITSQTKGIMEVCDELCAIPGYERSELLPMTWAELTHPGDLDAGAAHFNPEMAGDRERPRVWVRPSIGTFR